VTKEVYGVDKNKWKMYIRYIKILDIKSFKRIIIKVIGAKAIPKIPSLRNK